TDGNIIAAIITSHTPRNHANVPRSVHGPPSMPFIQRAVSHQPTAASRNSSTTSPTRVRAAAHAGPGPARTGAAAACAEAVTDSGGPGELGRRQAGLALVRDAEGVDVRTLGPGDPQVPPGRAAHAVPP